MEKKESKILVIDDGNKGNFIQAYGIAKNFPSPSIEILKVDFKGPKYKLPGRKGSYPLLLKIFNIFCNVKMFKAGLKFLKFYSKNVVKVLHRHYDFIISAGSLLAPINVILSKNTGGKSVQIMIPSGISLSLFDFLIIPYHDFLRLKKKSKNLIVTLGAPNLIDEEYGKSELNKIPEYLKNKIKKKVIAILIGGDDQNYRISLRWIENLSKILEKMKGKYQFFLSTSRRTDKKVEQHVMENLKKRDEFLYIEIPSIAKKSLYPGFLFLSDIIMVTEDSINMISESVSTGKKVIILGVERKNKKELIFDKSIEKFIKEGFAEYIPAENLNQVPVVVEKIKGKPYKKLNEAKECVQEILRRLN